MPSRLKKSLIPEEMDYATLSKAELIRRLTAFEQANHHEIDPGEAHAELEHKLQVHQIELEMQNRELRETRHELEASRDRYTELYDFAPMPYFDLDERTVIRGLNLAGADFLGLDRGRTVGAAFGSFLEPESARALRELMTRCVQTRLAVSTELRIRTGPDRWTPVRLTAIFKEYLEETSGAFLVTLLDLTDRLKADELARNYTRDLERQVAERTAALIEANAELELFTTSVAHDLRSPLRVMHGYIEMLLDESRAKLGPEGAAYAERVLNSANRLDRLLKDLLEYSRISRGDLQLQPLDLRELIEDLVKAQRGAAKEGGAQIDVIGPSAYVRGHWSALSQVLSNLLENAMKFVAPSRTPEITVRIEPSERMVRVWVEDNGIGIKRDYHARIFSIFERAHGGPYDGTGIGLAIAKRAVTRMGGRIGVESEVDRGSKFWIELPAA